MNLNSIIPEFFLTNIFYLLWNIINIIYICQNFIFELKPATLNIYRFSKQHGISQREQEILKLLLLGLTNEEIGRKIFIETGTVKRHLHNIYDKTGLSGRFKIIMALSGKNVSEDT